MHNPTQISLTVMWWGCCWSQEAVFEASSQININVPSQRICNLSRVQVSPDATSSDTDPSHMKNEWKKKTVRKDEDGKMSGHSCFGGCIIAPLANLYMHFLFYFCFFVFFFFHLFPLGYTFRYHLSLPFSSVTPAHCVSSFTTSAFPAVWQVYLITFLLSHCLQTGLFSSFVFTLQ